MNGSRISEYSDKMAKELIDRAIYREKIDRIERSIREMIARYVIIDHDTDQMHHTYTRHTSA